MLTLDNLPTLIVLKLIECEYLGGKMTCSSGGFPLLQSLRLVALPELQELQVEDGAMPVLKTLQIAKCPKMKKLSCLTAIEKSSTTRAREDGL